MAYCKTNISQKCGNKSCTCVIFTENQTVQQKV